MNDLPVLSDLTATLSNVQQRRFAPYRQQVSMDVEWIGSIPLGWQIKRVKYLGAIKYGLGEPPERKDDGLPFVRATDIDGGRISLDKLQRVDPLDVPWSRDPKLKAKDILVVRSGAYTGDSAIVPPELDGAIAGYDMVLSVSKAHPEFVAYALLSKYMLEGQIYLAKMRAAQPHLNAEELGSFFVILPSLEEQQAIADFLDRGTSRIDALIAKKRQLIDLLQEKRAAIISHAVAGSQRGMEVRLRHFSELLPGFAFPSQGFSHDADDVRLLRGINIRPSCLDWEDTVYWPREDAKTYSEYVLRPGDIVLGMDRPWISSGMRVARIAADDVPSLLLRRVARLRAAKHLSQDYLELLLSSRQFTGYFEPILTGVSVPHISPEQIGDFRFVLPPPNEQSRICGEVSCAVRKIDVANQTIRCAIEELVEYRTALISAAVTGKIDVRGQ